MGRLQIALKEGPTAHGFGTPLRTLKWVRVFIERQFGVRYSEAHVWRLLGQMGVCPPEARTPCPGARRGGDRGLKEAYLATAQKNPPKGATDRLHRRVGILAASNPDAHLAGERAKSGGAVPLRLAPHLGHCRTAPHRALLSPVRQLGQRAALHGIPQNPYRPPATAAAYSVGRRQAPTAAARCATTSTPPRARSRSSACPPKPRKSNPWNTSGLGSSVMGWPTIAPTLWTNCTTALVPS